MNAAPDILPGAAIGGLTFDSFIWIDYSILTLIVISGVMGLLRGLVREIFALATWGAAAAVSVNFSKPLAAYWEAQIPIPSARIAAAVAVLFVMTLMVGGLLAFLLGELVYRTGLTGTDRLLGLVFGLLRGAFIVALLVFVAGLTPLPNDPWWQESVLIPPFQKLAVWLKEVIPASLAGFVNFQ